MTRDQAGFLDEMWNYGCRIVFTICSRYENQIALEAYGLTGCHASIAQINNYAVLLTDIGEAQRGYSAVMKLGRKVRERKSDQCLDYGLIRQTLGAISLAQGRVQQANVHWNKVMVKFKMVFEDVPVLLE